MVVVEEYLKNQGIEYILHWHPAIFNCEDAKKYGGDIPGLHCKNLFLQDKEGERFFLVVLPEDKKLDFSRFAKIVDVKKVFFADCNILKEKLQLDPGSVSLFGVLNDEKREVEIYLCEEIVLAPSVGFHPNINTATLELSQDMLQKFLAVIDRPVTIIKI